MIPGLNLIEKDLNEKITSILDKIGVHYRIFSRTKSRESIAEKIERKKTEGNPYEINGKLMQDIIGIRIVTYFIDDINIVYSILKKNLIFFDEEIDDLELTVFKPKRTNIICKFKTEHSKTFNEIKYTIDDENFKLIDNTFELQLRTILSEGWHEIDHSLRYKCKKDWDNHKEEERLLNGIYASLETNDIALKNLFNELAYKHYKNKNWEGLIKTKFRIKIQLKPLNEDIINVLNHSNIGKKIFRIDRRVFLTKISNNEFTLPLNLNNIIYLLNIFEFKETSIFEITPEIILKEFELT